MPSVVLDASSLVGALLKKGSVPERAVRLAADTMSVCLSPQVWEEVTDVFGRSKFMPYALSGRAELILGLLTRNCLFFEPTVPVTDCRDSKDNKYLELALAARAVAVISSDADLLVLHPWRGIPILSPAEFVARFT